MHFLLVRLFRAHDIAFSINQQKKIANNRPVHLQDILCGGAKFGHICDGVGQSVAFA